MVSKKLIGVLDVGDEAVARDKAGRTKGSKEMRRERRVEGRKGERRTA